MNEYTDFFFKTISKHARDKYFQMVLNYFNNNSINILEIGCARRLEMDESNNPAKEMDGWSSLFWANYIKNNGGSLTIIDTELEALANCKTLLSDFINEINVNFILDDGLNHINNSYDLIFLDGSDSIIECLKQFEKIDKNKTSVLLDDAHLKGVLVRAKYKENKIDWNVNNEGHLMCFYPSVKLQNKSGINQNIVNSTNEEFDKNIINEVGETGRILVIEKNGEKIVIATPYSNNRNFEVLKWHKKIFNHFRFPINYFTFPAQQGMSHGMAVENFIRRTIHIADYYLIFDMDCIPLIPNFIDLVYSKICDKITLYGGVSQSNHKKGLDGTFNHPYIALANMFFSKELYLKCGCPTLSDHLERSDNGEEFTYRCEELGFCVSQLWPKFVEGLTDEECKELNMDIKYKFSNVGNGMKFGFGTNYSNVLYHQFCAPAKRHVPMFINKCKEVLNLK